MEISKNKLIDMHETILFLICIGLKIYVIENLGATLVRREVHMRLDLTARLMHIGFF